MTIQLNPRQERLLQDAMQHGRFHSMDEALDEALRSIAVPAETASAPISSSLRLTPAQAAARILELRKGQFLPDGMTIRALIDEGRR